MTGERFVLHQFPYSHYNEKARWALDWKGIAHERIDYLPGPHAPQMQRLSGQLQVPVLQIGARTIAGSAAIIDALELLQPEPALYPADAALRARAVDEALEATHEALELVARTVGASGQLAGDTFSVADLTAAANIALLVRVDHPDMARPDPVPESVQAFMARFASHPALRWVLDQYRRHRPKRAV